MRRRPRATAAIELTVGHCFYYLGGLMSERLPELIDPRKAVSNEAGFEGQLPLSQFVRLRAMLDDSTGSVHYALRFGRDDQGRGTITGHVETGLRVRCQRCGGTLLLPVESAVSLALVDGIDEAEALPDDYDPWLLEGRLMRSADLIEDELILSVPPIPRHADGQCEAPAGAQAADAVASAVRAAADGGKDRNPFAELVALKRTRDE